MHKVKLPQSVRDRARARSRRDRIYENISPEKAALLVVDMQNYFVEEGAPAEVPAARGIVPNINRLAGTVRLAGGTVIWVYTTFPDPDDERHWLYLDYFVPPEKREYLRSCLKQDNDLHKLWPGLEPEDGDLWIEKDRYSAFIDGSSVLADELRERGIDTVVITGTLTNVCCESTARDAMMRNFKVIMIEDANAARTDEDHINGLSTIVQVFGDVIDTDQMITELALEKEKVVQAAV